jgi:DNA-binding XRE family transcriptional regulator
MPNIAAVLKEEITRIARREIKSETEKLKKATSQYRSDIAALKRRIAELEKQVGRVNKKSPKLQPAHDQTESSKMRFVAKGFASLRAKLGLSAADMGKLIGVSAQTVYHWETEKSRPRQSQLPSIAAIRKIGNREAAEILAG